MPVLLISSDAPEVAQSIAAATAKVLAYDCLGPEILPEIAAAWHQTVKKLSDALDKNPTASWGPRAKSWYFQLACIETEVLERLKKDNLVCWGLAAHLYAQGVSHVLKVRVLADGEQSAKSLADATNISIKKAAKRIENRNRKREQWSSMAFGQSELEPSMYDLVINMGQIDPDEAAKTIAGAAGYRKFQPMTYSVKSLSEIALAARVKAKLLASLADIRVQVRDGRVVVTTKALKRERQKKAAMIKEIAGAIEGVEFVEVHLINYIIREAAQSDR